MSEIEIHELALAFPPLEGEAFTALVEDIRANGLITPITLSHDGKILDGRNRYKAARAAGVELDRQQDFEVYPDAPHDELVAFVVSKNYHRRHLSESQRAMVAARMVRGGASTQAAADRLNVSRETVRKAHEVLANADTNVISMVDHGKQSVHRAHQAVKGVLADPAPRPTPAKGEGPEPRPPGRPRGNARVNALRRGLEAIVPLADCHSEIIAHWPSDDHLLESDLAAAADLLNAIRRRHLGTQVA